MKIPKNFIKSAQLYKKVALRIYEETAEARNKSHGEPILPCPYDFSEQALLAMYEYETLGKGYLAIDGFSTQVNGYAIGQKWLNIELGNKKEIYKEVCNLFGKTIELEEMFKNSIKKVKESFNE